MSREPIQETQVVQQTAHEPVAAQQQELSPAMMQPISGIRQVSGTALNELRVPGRNDSLAASVSTAAPGVGAVHAAAARTGVVSPQREDNVFALSSNPAKAVVDLGLAIERKKTQRFAELRNQIQAAKTKADGFLNVQSECQKLSPDKKSHPISPEFKELLVKHNLIAADKQELTTDELMGIRSAVSTRLENLRTMEMQIPFMEAEKVSSELKSILDSVQKMMQSATQVGSHANRKVGH